MKTTILIVIAALGIYIWTHRPSPAQTPTAVIAATPAPAAGPIIIANAPDGSLQNRFNKGPNAQTSLTAGATWK
jgi:hypothetical protein